MLDAEAFEIACEDARRRRLTSVPALRRVPAPLRRPGAGCRALRSLLAELDPVHPARSTLEVKTRRLLVANGVTDFVREFPLDWNGRTYRFDFASSSSGRSSRPTAVAGTTTRPTTSTTTRSGACPAATAIASCSPPGTRSRRTPTHSCKSSQRRSQLHHRFGSIQQREGDADRVHHLTRRATAADRLVALHRGRATGRGRRRLPCRSPEPAFSNKPWIALRSFSSSFQTRGSGSSGVRASTAPARRAAPNGFRAGDRPAHRDCVGITIGGVGRDLSGPNILEEGKCDELRCRPAHHLEMEALHGSVPRCESSRFFVAAN